ncbi:MAG: hypothetical protein ACRD0P_07660 [Stackebrandtia sp.]
MTDTRPSKIKPVKDGHLPISELTAPMSAAGSPFGEDVSFPLPTEELNYEHAEKQPPRER